MALGPIFRRMSTLSCTTLRRASASMPMIIRSSARQFYMCVQNCGEPIADCAEDRAVDCPYTLVDQVQCTEELVSL